MSMSELVAQCELAWAAIQARNPDVPDAVICIGTGGRRAPTLYGHFAPNSWSHSEDDVHEVLIVAEQLSRPAKDIFCTLHHEAVHGVAESRGIKDVSGRSHNKRFLEIAQEMGMLPPEKRNPKIGWSAVRLSEDLEQEYAAEIAGIEQALSATRKLQLKAAKPQSTWIAACDCGRKIRMPKKTINEMPEELDITCNLCGGDFRLTPEHLDDYRSQFG